MLRNLGAERDAQGLSLLTQSFSLRAGCPVPPLGKANTENENVTLTELDALFVGTGLDVFQRDCMSGPGVVRQRLLSAIRVVLH